MEVLVTKIEIDVIHFQDTIPILPNPHTRLCFGIGDIKHIVNFNARTKTIGCLLRSLYIYVPWLRSLRPTYIVCAIQTNESQYSKVCRNNQSHKSPFPNSLVQWFPNWGTHCTACASNIVTWYVSRSITSKTSQSVLMISSLPRP